MSVFPNEMELLMEERRELVCVPCVIKGSHVERGVVLPTALYYIHFRHIAGSL